MVSIDFLGEEITRSDGTLAQCFPYLLMLRRSCGVARTPFLEGNNRLTPQRSARSFNRSQVVLVKKAWLDPGQGRQWLHHHMQEILGPLKHVGCMDMEGSHIHMT